MLAIAAVHFNFAGFINPVRNLHSFCRDMEMRGIPVFGLEYKLPHVPARMLGRRGWSTEVVTSRSIMFQKEHMMNRIVNEQIPDCYNHIMCCDADLFFSEKNLDVAIAAAMATHRAIQPFETACWTDKSGGVNMRCFCTGKRPLTSHWHSHPGFAWVMHRDFWTRGPGLYPYGVAGSGDTVLSLALTGQPIFKAVREKIGEKQFESGIIQKYMEDALKWSGKRVGYIPGRAYHMYHGSLPNRGYRKRENILRDVDAVNDIIISPSGVMEWAPHVPECIPNGLLDYFKGRDEDN
jgi:hypothetical protein